MIHIKRINEMVSRKSSDLADVVCNKLSIEKLPNSFEPQDDGSYEAHIDGAYMKNKMWDALKNSDWTFVNFHTEDTNWRRAMLCIQRNKTPNEMFADSKYKINKVMPIYQKLTDIFDKLNKSVKKAILDSHYNLCDWVYISPDNGIALLGFDEYVKKLIFTGVKKYNISMRNVDKIRDMNKKQRSDKMKQYMEDTKKDRMFNKIKEIVLSMKDLKKLSFIPFVDDNTYTLYSNVVYSTHWHSPNVCSNLFIVKISRAPRGKNNQIPKDKSISYLKDTLNGWDFNEDCYISPNKAYKAYIKTDYPDFTNIYLIVMLNEDYVMDKIQKYNPDKSDIDTIKKMCAFDLKDITKYDTWKSGGYQGGRRYAESHSKEFSYLLKLKTTSIENIGKCVYLTDLANLYNTQEYKIATYIFDKYKNVLNVDYIDECRLFYKEHYDTGVYYDVDVCLVEDGKVYFNKYYAGMENIKRIMQDLNQKFGINECYELKEYGELPHTVKITDKPLYVINK